MTPTQRLFFAGYLSGLIVAIAMSVVAMNVHF